MYSTSIKQNRCRVECIIVAEDIAVENFVVDTGAMYTCCNYLLVNDKLDETSLKDCETSCIGGLIEGDKVRFYKYALKQFTIGNIDLGEQSIWITFDQRVTDIILGMDILRQIMMIINPYNQQVHFCRNYIDYRTNFEPLLCEYN